MTNPKPAGGISYLHLALAGVFSPVLIASSIGVLLSLCAALVGPVWGFLIGIVAFALGVVGAAYSEAWFTRACPQGLSGVFGWLLSWRRPIHVIAATVATAWLGAAVVLGCSARLDGHLTDAADPVFAEHHEYALTQHAKVTPISKARYWTIATSFTVTWHSLALLFSIVALRGLLFGDRLKSAQAPVWTTARESRNPAP
jgi:hypothetical protein